MLITNLGGQEQKVIYMWYATVTTRDGKLATSIIKDINDKVNEVLSTARLGLAPDVTWNQYQVKLYNIRLRSLKKIM
jgi:hypothetical protein